MHRRLFTIVVVLLTVMVAFPATAAADHGIQYNTSSPSLAIPDDDVTGVSDTITVAESGTVNHINVYVDIDHSAVGDLEATLSHGGTTVTLFDNIPSDGPSPTCLADGIRASFDDDLGVSGDIQDSCPGDGSVISGQYVPHEALSAFDGMDPAGDWTLTIVDNVDKDTGTLNEWSLRITRAPQVGLVDIEQGMWHLSAVNGSGGTKSFFYGNPGDLPIAGDWDGDGIDTPGLYRQSDGFFYTRDSNNAGPADDECFAGNPNDVPLSGDWDADFVDELGLYRPSNQTFYLFEDSCTGSPMGAADIEFVFGNPGDTPVSGDWDRDGITEIGLYRESTGFFYWKEFNSTGVADGQIFYGNPEDRFVASDWGNDDGIDTPGVFRPSDQTFYFRHSLTQGTADNTFQFGQSGWLPVEGFFGV